MEELILDRIDKNFNNEEKIIVAKNIKLFEKMYIIALMDAEKIKE